MMIYSQGGQMVALILSMASALLAITDDEMRR
jgi:hypothetical protein